MAVTDKKWKCIIDDFLQDNELKQQHFVILYYSHMLRISLVLYVFFLIWQEQQHSVHSGHMILQ